jgi:hypothetical protein
MGCSRKYGICGMKKKYMFAAVLLFIHNSFAQLTSVTLTPGNSAAGSSSIHQLTFTATTPVPVDGIIIVTYPSQFNTSEVLIASSATPATLNGSLSVSNSGTTLILARTGGSTPASGVITIRLANVRNATTAAVGYQVTVQTTDNVGNPLDTGNSAAFTMTAASLDHFSITGIGSSVVAGTSTSITVRAQDVHGNLVSSFTAPLFAELSDLTGSLSSAQTDVFTSGAWTGNVYFTKTMTANILTVSAQGKSGSLGPFAVAPAALGSFAFETISSPKVAGTQFPVVIRAKDTYGNVKTDFTGSIATVAMEETKNGSLTVMETGTKNTGGFTTGEWNGNVRIVKAAKDVMITATGSGKSGNSSTFNVDAAAVDHFNFGSIGSQSAGAPFPISMLAMDANENNVLSFTGRVNLSLSPSATVTPVQTGNFINGAWSGDITIPLAQNNYRLNANEGSSPTGQSLPFNVVAGSTVHHFRISSIPSTQTAGGAFMITIRAEDAGNNLVSFSGPVNLKDETGTLQSISTTVTLQNGTATVYPVIYKAATGDYLTVNGLGKVNTSNPFNVLPASLNHFIQSYGSSPKTAGIAFLDTIKAVDPFGNLITGFNETVGIEADNVDAGSLPVLPSTSAAFSSGMRIQSMTLTRAANDVQITVRHSGGSFGVSGRFNVIAGSLHHFSLAQVADQATGLAFAVTITAQDANNNKVTDFSGPTKTVAIGHTGTGAITPAVSGAFTDGSWLGNVTVVTTQVSDRIQVSRTGGSENGASNVFAVNPNIVDHYVIGTINSIQTAGSEFACSIRAVDASENTVTGFNGNANLYDETGTGSPTSINFTGGTWNGKVKITRSLEKNTLTVTGGGKSGGSTEFDVRPAAVDTFSIGLIGSPKNAGVEFPITITAKDAYGNTVSGFGASVSIQDGTGSVSPVQSGYFTGGVRTETVVISKSSQDIALTVNDGAGHTGRSNFFNVLPGPVNHFDFTVLGNQVAGIPFTLIVTAKDQYESKATSFTGTVDMSDLTGTLNPTRSGSFTEGSWPGSVTLSQAMVNDLISVVRTGGSESGRSNPFTVFAQPGVRVAGFLASRTTVTAGQTQPTWGLTLAVKNLASAAATLDSVRIRFHLTGVEQSDYRLVLPAKFKGSQTRILAGNGVDTLSISVDQTGKSSGEVTADAVVFMTDGGTGQAVSAQGFTGITVQDSARLRIDRIRLSQAEVTAGQTRPWWTASVILTNTGGADVLIDSAGVKTYITFSSGTGWSVKRPVSLGNRGWVLSGGATDSLLFDVRTTASNQTGTCVINAAVGGIERNTGRALTADTQNGGSASVLVESAALMRIRDMQIVAPYAPYLDVGQEFSVRVILENAGGDGLHNVSVDLITDGGSSILETVPVIESFPGRTVIPSGSLKTLVFPVQAGGAADPREIFTVRVAGRTDNTEDEIPVMEDTASVVIQNSASLFIPKVNTTSTLLVGGQKDPWQVKVTVRNLGQAGLVLTAPKAEDLSFWINDLVQVDYSVTPPTALKRGGLFLAGGAVDTLVYTVTTTGNLGGSVQIRVKIKGQDQNTQQAVSFDNTATVTVQSVKAFRIISTQVLTLNRTDAGNGYVNTGQEFQVLVIVENGISQTVRDVSIRLKTSGRSLLVNSTAAVNLLKPTQSDSVYFWIHADTAANPSEILTSHITSAILETSGQAAPVGTAIDSTAQVILQTPAFLSLAVETTNPAALYSTGQTFQAKARLLNRGGADLLGAATVQLILPQGYRLLSASDTLRLTPESPVEWAVQAPTSPDSLGKIGAALIRVPKDRNTGEQARVLSATVLIRIVTVASRLSAAGFIISPDGAKDGVMSAGQSFVIRVSVVTRHVKDAVAQIVLPRGYSTGDNLEKSVFGDDLLWQIKAPEAAGASDPIQILVRGLDSLQQDIVVTGLPASIPVRTVSRAELELNLAITDPPDVADDNTVSLGQEFVIRATVSKYGDADTVGTVEATLQALPSGYTTVDPVTRTLENGFASWTIRAPMVQSADAVNIGVRLTKAPLDENTLERAFVRKPNDAVPVTIEGSWLSVSLVPVQSGGYTSVVPGQEGIRLLVLEFDNRGVEGSVAKALRRGVLGANSIVLKSIGLQVEDRFGNPIPPDQALKKLTVADNADTTRVYGDAMITGNENPVTISFTTLPVIPVDANVELAVFATIAEEPTADYFQLNLPDGDWIVAKDQDSNNAVPVKTPASQEWQDWRSDPKKIFSAQTEPPLWNSPNPFGGPGRETTRITYCLGEDMDVSFRLFTLVGEPVWSASFRAGETNGSKGIRFVVWDGRNDQGRKVLNGVYLLFMKTADGKVQKLKIAVVK